jgi:formyltetrahydrofolate hydrolase
MTEALYAPYVPTLNCANRPGIVAAVAGALFEAGGDIREAQQFDDTATNRFFMRVVFDMVPATTEDALREASAPWCISSPPAWMKARSSSRTWSASPMPICPTT